VPVNNREVLVVLDLEFGIEPCSEPTVAEPWGRLRRSSAVRRPWRNGRSCSLTSPGLRDRRS
jgi:hypothetical protein